MLPPRPKSSTSSWGEAAPSEPPAKFWSQCPCFADWLVNSHFWYFAQSSWRLGVLCAFVAAVFLGCAESLPFSVLAHSAFPRYS